MPPRFSLGRVVATPGAIATLERNNAQAITFLGRHQTGDWGDLDQTDRIEIEGSLRHGYRFLSAYTLGDGTRIWITIEADRH